MTNKVKGFHQNNTFHELQSQLHFEMNQKTCSEQASSVCWQCHLYKAVTVDSMIEYPGLLYKVVQHSACYNGEVKRKTARCFVKIKVLQQSKTKKHDETQVNINDQITVTSPQFNDKYREIPQVTVICCQS